MRSKKLRNKWIEKLTEWAMIAAVSAWIAWLFMGGGLQYDALVDGTYMAAGVCGAAFIIKMIWRYRHA